SEDSIHSPKKKGHDLSCPFRPKLPRLIDRDVQRLIAVGCALRGNGHCRVAGDGHIDRSAARCHVRGITAVMRADRVCTGWCEAILRESCRATVQRDGTSEVRIVVQELHGAGSGCAASRHTHRKCERPGRRFSWRREGYLCCCRNRSIAPSSVP